MKKGLVFLILLLISHTYAQEDIRDLIEKVKKAPPEERYIRMNELKLRLRELKEEQRKEIIRIIYRELSGKEKEGEKIERYKRADKPPRREETEKKQHSPQEIIPTEAREQKEIEESIHGEEKIESIETFDVEEKEKLEIISPEEHERTEKMNKEEELEREKENIEERYRESHEANKIPEEREEIGNKEKEIESRDHPPTEEEELQFPEESIKEIEEKEEIRENEKFEEREEEINEKEEEKSEEKDEREED